MWLILYVYMLSGLFAGAAGAVFAWSTFGVTASTAFDLIFSLQMLAMIIIGGMGTSSGPLIGAAIVYLLYYEFLAYSGFPGGQALVVGVAVIVIALFVPDGIVGIFRRKYPRLKKVLE